MTTKPGELHCGTPVARQWLLGAHQCEYCSSIVGRIDKLVAWTRDPDFGRTATDPLQALTDLHVARVTANRLIRQIVADARDEGATWEQIGELLHVDPRDASARFR